MDAAINLVTERPVVIDEVPGQIQPVGPSQPDS